MRVFRRFGEVLLSDDIDGFMKLVGDELMCGENTTTGEVFTPLQLQQQKSDSVRLAAANPRLQKVEALSMSIAPVKEPPEPRITQPAPELRDRLRRSRSCGMRPCPSKASTAPVREIGREALR